MNTFFKDMGNNSGTQSSNRSKTSNHELPLKREAREKQEFSSDGNGRFNVGIGAGLNGTTKGIDAHKKFVYNIGNTKHGEFFEVMNHQQDVLHFRNAEWKGHDNVKNGADRLLNGAEIQSKCCKTGRACIQNCLDKNKNFKYYASNKKPMTIEVPFDCYEDACGKFEELITSGKIKRAIPGDSKKYIKQSPYTYQQAVNASKFGTIESLKFDARAECVNVAHATTITFMITFASAIYAGKSKKDALELAVKASISAGMFIGVQGIAQRQFLKWAGAEQVFSYQVGMKGMNIVGHQGYQFVANIGREVPIYGAAARSAAAKRFATYGGMVVGGVLLVGQSAYDLNHMANGRMSGQQVTKNAACNAAAMVGGWEGSSFGAGIGTIFFPGIGTSIGTVVGAILGGVASQFVTKTALDQVVEDDIEEMFRILKAVVQNLAEEYLFNDKEVEAVVDMVDNGIGLDRLLKEMYCHGQRENFATMQLRPLFEKVAHQRPFVSIPPEAIWTNNS